MPENTIVNEIDTPEEVEVEKEKIAVSRKLIVSGVVLVVGVVVALVKGDIPEHLLQLLEVVFGGFIIGNVAGHALGVSADTAALKYGTPDTNVTVTAASQPSVDTSAIATALEQQTQQISIIQQTLLMIIKKAGLDK